MQTPRTRDDIDVSLVTRLVASQFPQWSDLPIRPVGFEGWDNKTFRLGDELSVRLPSGPSYAAQVEKEHQWLPQLARHLPLPIPTPVARGTPTADFPMPWSVYRWIEGEIALLAHIEDLPLFASALAAFLVALQRIDAKDGPPPGMHSYFRGCPMTLFDSEISHNTPGNWGTREAIAALEGRIDADAATEVWEAALDAATWGDPVWVHGDVDATNLLVQQGRLSAVIDFGCSAVGDPACDLVIAWTFFSGESRKAFRAGLPLDNATWARGRGWALWKASIVSAATIDTDPDKATRARRVIEAVIADHKGED